MDHQTFVNYKNYRYLKLILWMVLVAIGAYALHQPSFGAYGGTWLGYVLGSLSAAIVLLLLWFGIRKRQYNGIGQLKGWLSAHIYLGAALLVFATLHTGFQFGWNVHTLAYALLVLLVINGFYGVYAYLHFPRMITENLGDDSLQDLLNKIAELDRLARTHALQLPDDINAIVMKACQETKIGGNVLQQLTGRHPDCPTAAAVKVLREYGHDLKFGHPKLYRELYLIMLQKETLVARARRDVMLRSHLEVWLYLHVPLAVALLVALTAHVTAIFFYW
ncbi:MAG: hypothetical protein N2Z69_07770 [Methylophilaceae bacterium]|nr:hypothetical protein [Methylophilaceae bacterium]